MNPEEQALVAKKEALLKNALRANEVKLTSTQEIAARLICDVIPYYMERTQSIVRAIPEAVNAAHMAIEAAKANF